MSHKVQEPLDGGAKVAGQNPVGDRPDQRLFNAVELRLFRYTAVLLSLVALTALIGIILWAFSWVLNEFYNLLLSLSLAGILALVLHPVVEFLETRLHLPRLLAIILLLMAFFASIGGLIFLLVPTLVSQIVQLMTVLPNTLANWQEHFSIYFPELSAMISSSMENGDGKESLPVLKDPGTTIMNYLGLLAGISFVPLFLFFTPHSWLFPCSSGARS
ncbi:AI-2E family transporter [Marinobacter sp. HN1S83]|uniref:AI-2E family transporter n=1 Tax=Marinobacter sp. HN1S83 TaxID=3382301 RepID=UPI00387B8355